MMMNLSKLFALVCFVLMTCVIGYGQADCALATVVSCGHVDSYPAPTDNYANASNYNVTGCTSLFNSYDGNDRMFYLDIGGALQDVTIEISGLTADMDLFLFKSCSSHPGDFVLSNCQDASTNPGTADESVFITWASGEFFFLVDGVEAGITSEFTVTVTCSPPGAAQACDTGTDLYCGNSLYVPDGGANSFDINNYDLSGCTHASYNYEGNDHLFNIHAGSSYTTMTIEMTGLTDDLDMFLFSSCSDGGTTNFSHCVGMSDNGGTSNETIVIPNAYGSYYLIVDGFASGVSSGFTISVTCHTSSSGSCNDAEDLYCGETRWVYAPTHDNFDLYDYNLSYCGWGGYHFNGKDHFYKIDVGHNYSDLVIDLTGFSSDMDMILFESCSYSSGHYLSNCAAYSAYSGLSSERIVLNNAYGEYYLVVESADPWWTSGYEISVDCQVAAPNPCQDAPLLSCGDWLWVDAPDYNNFDHYSLYGCSTYNPYYTGKDKLFIIDAGYSYQNMVISLTGLSADMDMILFRECENHYGLGELSDCVGHSYNSGSANEEIIIHNAYGYYYLLVDSDDPWWTSGFEISVDCIAPAPDPCYDATPLYCGDWKWVNAPTKNNLDNYSTYGCPSNYYGYTGKDHLYEIHADGYGQDLTITLSNISADLDLLLFRNCEDHYGNSELTECIDISATPGYSSETITIYNASGTYYLAVDSNDPWYTSGYEISVDCHYPQPDPCHDATWLYCNDWRWVEAPYYNHYNSNNYDVSYCYGGSDIPDYNGFDHLYVVDAGYGGKDLKIILSNLSADMDLLVYQECSNGYGYNELSHCVGYSVKGGYHSEEVHIYNASGYYYIAVEAYDPWRASGYEIEVICTEDHYSCSDAEYLNCGDSKWISSSYSSHFNDGNYVLDNCYYHYNDYSGSDHFFAVDVGIDPVDLDIEISGLSGDLDLLVFNSCSSVYDDVRVGNCIEISANSGSVSEKVSIEDATGTYYIVVDTRYGYVNSGFQIDITCLSEDPPNDDPPNDDPPNDDPPAEPEVLNCGQVISSSNIDTESSFGNEDINECYSTSLIFSGGDVLIPFEKAADNDIIQLTMVQESANLSLFILDADMNFVASGCRAQNFNQNKVRDNSDNIGEVYSDEGLLAAGTYYALIDGYNRTITSNFTLSLACGAICPIADTLVCESLVQDIDTEELENNRSEYGTDTESNWVGYSGPEWSSTLVIDDSAEVTIDVYNILSDGDLDLFILDSCTGSNYLAASTNEAGEDESVSIEVGPGSYTIVVDGWAGSSGIFDIEVTGCEDGTTALIDPIGESRTVNRKQIDQSSSDVVPNPFSDKTTIRLVTETSGSGEMTLFNVAGQLIHKTNISLTKGVNLLEIEEEVQQHHGLILYRIITESEAFHGSMIRVK